MRQEHTRNNVQHVSIIQARWDIALFLLFDERLEHPDRSAMNIARYEADACVHGLGVLLHLDDKPVPFLLVRLGSPVVVLAHKMSLAFKEEEESILTRSSSSSASALNLLTKPDKPIEPFRPRATKGLSFESSAVSRNTIRG